jgi:hypothetical protein
MRWAALFGFLASIPDATWLIRILLALVRRRLAAIECPEGSSANLRSGLASPGWQDDHSIRTVCLRCGKAEPWQRVISPAR